MSRGSRRRPAPDGAGLLVDSAEPVRAALLVDCTVDGRRLPAGTVVEGARDRLRELFGAAAEFSPAQVAHNLAEGMEVVIL